MKKQLTISKSGALPRSLAAFVLAICAITLAPVRAQAQTYTVLYTFNHSNDPSNFQDPGLIPQGRDGSLYDNSTYGGTSGVGTIFSMSPSGIETTLYSFDGSKGTYPYFGLTLGSDGNFYGGTSQGGTSNFGVLYKSTSTGTVTLLHNFTNTGDGISNIPPTQGTDGNSYGNSSPHNSSSGCIYRLTPTGVFTILHTTVDSDGAGGGFLIQGTDGSFYGDTASGGGEGCGTVFKVSAAGVLTVLHSFACTTEGRGVGTPLVQATDGNFYGYATGGASGQVIFKISTSGAFTMLHIMTAAEGNASRNGLIQATDGNLYGSTYGGGTFNNGTIFKITLGGALTVLFNADPGNTNGVRPVSNLTQHTNGLLYGVTLGGGANNAAVFYSLDVGLGPFASLVTTSGMVGAEIGILGQGFSDLSVVQFGGVQATTVTREGTTFLNATVPAGARTGFVTVTTGATTLTSNREFIVTPLTLTNAVSRKIHGGAGTFDVPLPLTGTAGVESRTGGASNNHTLVFTFNNNDLVSGNASVTTGSGAVSGSPTFSANTMTVNLTGVADVQKITVTLSNVTDSFSQVLPDTTVSVNMLIGDVTGNKTVNGTDVSQTKLQSGAAVSAANFREDVNANGSINGTDVSIVKSRSGNGVP